VTAVDGSVVRFLQRGIHHAQFTAEFGQTPQDRHAAKRWILEAGAVIRVIYRLRKVSLVEVLQDSATIKFHRSGRPKDQGGDA